MLAGRGPRIERDHPQALCAEVRKKHGRSRFDQIRRESGDIRGKAFLKLGPSPSSMGVVREIVRSGKPGTRPKVGDRVTMHYECRLKETGKIVDSSKIKGRAAEFQIGTGRVIQGWDEGVMEMEDGEEAILKV
jgi:FKBP-type peptidyl-prolyl cis-trans isomerase